MVVFLFFNQIEREGMKKPENCTKETHVATDNGSCMVFHVVKRAGIDTCINSYCLYRQDIARIFEESEVGK